MPIAPATPSPAAFLLLRTRESAYQASGDLRATAGVVWTAPVYGPHQVVAYLVADSPRALAENIESLRVRFRDGDLDARVCKVIPGDEDLSLPATALPEVAVLLIGVDHREEKERVVAARLRALASIAFARAMWGPADIIAIAQASDPETLRDVICDQVKVLRGLSSNTTLYCYPAS